MELIKTLSDAEIEQIRDRTEELLETVGLRVDHSGLLRMCQGAGAIVDEPARGCVSRGRCCASCWRACRRPTSDGAREGPLPEM